MTTLSEQAIASYRENGFVHLPEALSPAEVGRFRKAAAAAFERERGAGSGEPDVQADRQPLGAG